MPWTIETLEYKKMIDDCVDGFPLEACGIFLGPINNEGIPTGEICEVWPSNNSEQSARIYTVDPQDMFEATKYGIENGIEIVGIYHSHTHTEAWPSPTDIDKVVDPNWCYAIVSLAEEDIQVNFFQIFNGEVQNISCEEI